MPKDAQNFIADAVALTRALQSDPHWRLPAPELYQGRSHEDLELSDPSIAEIDRDQRLASGQALDEAMRSRAAGDKRLVTARSLVLDESELLAMASSNGLSGVRETSLFAAIAQPTLRDQGERRVRGFYAPACVFQQDLPTAEHIAETALERALARLGSTKGPTKRTTLVVAPHAGAHLLDRLLAPASAAAFDQGQSFWRDIMNARTFSERLHIVDAPLLVRGLASRPFDDEGIAAKPLTLIDDGTPSGHYADSYYAHKTGIPVTTGTGSNRLVRPGKRALTEIIKDIDDGVYITGWAGGNANGTTGDFSDGVSGHVIRGGQIGEAVDGMNITGNLIELFAGLVEVGNDPWPHSKTRAPTLTFDSVQFSGS